MREKLSRRLERLEATKAAVDRAKLSPPGGPSVADIIRERLRGKGFVQTGDESLEETMARAFGMTPRELREDLRRRTAGADAD